MAERRNRKHSKIDGLPPDLKATVQQMLLDGDTYSEVIAYLQTQGVSISMSSVCRYAQAYLAEHEALMMANANLQRMMDEVSKYPDLDTTEAIIRIVSHNLLNVLSNTSEEDWQEVDLSKLLKETNALVRASAYKKRIALQIRTRWIPGSTQSRGWYLQSLPRSGPNCTSNWPSTWTAKRRPGLQREDNLLCGMSYRSRPETRSRCGTRCSLRASGRWCRRSRG